MPPSPLLGRCWGGGCAYVQVLEAQPPTLTSPLDSERGLLLPRLGHLENDPLAQARVYSQVSPAAIDFLFEETLIDLLAEGLHLALDPLPQLSPHQIAPATHAGIFLSRVHGVQSSQSLYSACLLGADPSALHRDFPVRDPLAEVVRQLGGVRRPRGTARHLDPVTPGQEG